MINADQWSKSRLIDYSNSIWCMGEKPWRFLFPRMFHPSIHYRFSLRFYCKLWGWQLVGGCASFRFHAILEVCNGGASVFWCIPWCFFCWKNPGPFFKSCIFLRIAPSFPHGYPQGYFPEESVSSSISACREAGHWEKAMVLLHSEEPWVSKVGPFFTMVFDVFRLAHVHSHMIQVYSICFVYKIYARVFTINIMMPVYSYKKRKTGNGSWKFCVWLHVPTFTPGSRDVLRLSLVTLDSNQGCTCRRDRIQ